MAMLQCDIATPEKQLFSGQVSMVEVPGIEGSFGVMPGHEMLASLVAKGPLKLFMDEGKSQCETFAAYHGYVQVHEDKVIVLVRYGINAKDVDKAAVTEELNSLKQQFDGLSEEDKATARAFAQSESLDAEDSESALASRATANTLLDEITWCELQLELA